MQEQCLSRRLLLHLPAMLLPALRYLRQKGSHHCCILNQVLFRSSYCQLYISNLKENKGTFSQINDLKEIVVELIEKGELPLRVTHNDTKLNNVLFDSDSDDAICVIDLDTVMPGLALYDLCDSIRFGANSCAEDDDNYDKVELMLDYFEAYAKGFLSEAGDALNQCEIDNLAFSAKLMTFECGMRFLTDYLNGDTYFKTAYPEHNLVRAKNQFALVADMERKMEQMQQIIKNITK